MSTTVPTLSWDRVLVVLLIVVGGMLLAGAVVIAGRALVKSDPNSGAGSVVRSWIAISLVMGLLVFCATAFLINDASLRSTLFGGLIASVGAAVAFYFSSKGADQARADILNAAVTLSQGGTSPTGFTDASPPVGSVGAQYLYTFAANGQPAPRYVKATGDLPPGLVLGSDGKLEGKPLTAGTYTFAVRATNAAGSATSPDVTITIS